MNNAEESLKKLQEGNIRFVSGNMKHPNLSQERRELTTIRGQTPFASIMGCSDSRVCVENIFDQGIGDLFVVRVAGNVVSTNEAASLEFAVEQLKTPLIIVLGHTHCGAVSAAVNNADVHGNIPNLLLQIKTALSHACKENPELEGEALVNKTIEQNVFESMNRLLNISPLIQSFISEGALKVIGAVFDIKTGQVQWLGNHPDQENILSRAS